MLFVFSALELCFLIVELQDFRLLLRNECRSSMLKTFHEATEHLSLLQKTGEKMRALRKLNLPGKYTDEHTEKRARRNRELFKIQNQARVKANHILQRLPLELADGLVRTANKSAIFQIKDFRMPKVRLSVVAVRDSDRLPIFELQEPFTRNQAGHASWSVQLRSQPKLSPYREALWKNLFKKVQDSCSVSIAPIDNSRVHFQALMIWDSFF